MNTDRDARSAFIGVHLWFLFHPRRDRLVRAMGAKRESTGSLGGGGFLLVLAAVVIALLAPVAPADAKAKKLSVQRRVLRIKTGTAISVTFRRANTAGNLIVAYAVWDGGGTVSLADTAGNAYVSAVGPTQPAGDVTN